MEKPSVVATELGQTPLQEEGQEKERPPYTHAPLDRAIRLAVEARVPTTASAEAPGLVLVVAATEFPKPDNATVSFVCCDQVDPVQ